jgi:2,4-dienoyl-CoA reductase-like NADH-dependent reductase (Old Yellow Enzyme family)
MSLDEIKDIVGQFERAAKNAIRAGFEGIELHGNSTSLPSSYLRSLLTQNRLDANGYLFRPIRRLT